VKRDFEPGRWDFYGRAVREVRAGAPSADQAEERELTELEELTELANDVAPDAERVIQPPVRTPEDDAYIARARRWAVFRALAAMALLAALLALFGARCFKH
jgi:hypothetical protein